MELLGRKVNLCVLKKCPKCKNVEERSDGASLCVRKIPRRRGLEEDISGSGEIFDHEGL